VFSEKHSRDEFLIKVAECFRVKGILSVTMSPNSEYDLPTKRKISIDEAGNQAWEMVRSDLIELSLRSKRPLNGIVEVSALVKSGA
jgi:hypothetical protein